MAEIWRLLDTGLAAPSRNVALNRALLEARDADEISSSLRFGRFTRCVLLGYRDSIQQVVDVGYCHDKAIELQRRITSGTATYVDEGQLLWELYLHRRDVGAVAMRAIVKRICHAAAVGLSALGFDARFRPSGDIEVDGRTISTLTCGVDGDAILVQSLLLMHVDLPKMAGALRLPGGKIGVSAIDLMRERIVGLDDLPGRETDAHVVKHNLVEAFESEFDVELREADLSLSEEARYQAAMSQLESRDSREIASPASELAVVEGSHKVGNGLLRVLLSYDAAIGVIRQVWFWGDVAMRPRRSLPDLEAALRDIPLTRVAQRIESFFRSRPVNMGTLTTGDFVAALRLAVRQPYLARDT
jgi:lipoate-protein ligase A